jgi:hypothetical protein
MMGQRTGGQKPLFYSFKLDDHVPADHLLRGIDRCLDLGELRHHLASFYSHTGRPSIDPELMMRMLIVGYSFGFAPSADCAKRSISIWPIAGSVDSAWRTRYQTIRPSRRTVTAVSGRAMPFGRCSRAWSSDA